MSVEKEIAKLKKRILSYLKRTGEKKTNLGLEIRNDGNTIPRLLADRLTVPNVLIVERWLNKQEKKK